VDFTEVKSLAQSLGASADTPVADDFVIPTNATSDFLANRAMGDWAEGKVSELLNNSGLVALGYGDDSSKTAGDDGFEEFYIANRATFALVGKKPDLLLFSKDVATELRLGDLRSLSQAEQDKVVPRALAGVEVRSSKFRAKKYRTERAAQRSRGKDVQPCQSFTPKREDLPAILRWLERYKVPHAFAQVFFDEIYMIGFDSIVRILDARTRLNLRKRNLPDEFEGYPTSVLSWVRALSPQNSNFKATHMIPVDLGVLVAEVPDWDLECPKFDSKTRESELGRVDAFVVPRGGNFQPKKENLARFLHELVGT
jgi:hypothetical protein